MYLSFTAFDTVDQTKWDLPSNDAFLRTNFSFLGHFTVIANMLASVSFFYWLYEVGSNWQNNHTSVWTFEQHFV